MAKGGEQLHLHIENSTQLGDVFDVTPSRLNDALAHHPEIARDVSITVGRDGDGFRDAMASADVLFAWDFERAGLAEFAPHLRWIQLQGAGVNHLLPLDWIPPGVTLTNSRGAHGERASEYLIMAILALNNGLPAMTANQRDKRWQQIHNSSIRGKTLLIYGVGNVGGDTATVAKQFGLRVLGIRRTGAPHESVDEMHGPGALRSLLPCADFVLISAPHTPATDHIFARQEFDLMKQGAGFINYSRSRLVDYEALRETLDAGRISAIVDVFDEEPLPDTSSLWHTPNLIITPHCGSNDPLHHEQRSLDLLFDNMRRFREGKELLNIVDPIQQY
ncbi:MAG: D-2-hydroxyacid dehydrogenase [Woeseiaceae bacterium]